MEEYGFKDLKTWVKGNKELVIILLVLLVAYFGFFVRIQSVPNFQDKYLMALDPYPYLRYAEQIVTDGYILPFDTLRYFPVGIPTTGLMPLHSYFSALLYFLTNIITEAQMITMFIWYPAIAAFLGFIAFYFAAKEFFNDKRIALLTSAFAAFTIGFLFRSAVGYADKEPLSVFLFPLVFFFFLKTIKMKDMKKKIVFGILSGLSTAALLANWGGGIFIIAAMSLLMLVIILLDRVNKNYIYSFSLWMTFVPFTILSSYIGNLSTMFTDLKYQIIIASFALMLFSIPISKKIKDYKGIPKGLSSLVIAMIILLIAIAIIKPSLIVSLTGEVFMRLTTPFGESRFTTSVSEFQKPFFLPNWWSSFGFSFFLLLGGAIFLFYALVKRFKFSKILTGVFSIVLLFFIFSNFSSDPKFSILTSVFSKYYIHSLVLFLIVLFYYYIKDWKTIKEEKNTINLKFILLLSWFLITIVAARGAIRSIWAVVMPASFLSAYFVITSSKMIKKKMGKSDVKDKFYILIPILIAIIIIFFSAKAMYETRFGATQEIQWDFASKWVKENTSQSAVFTHWWDYGYWVQSIFNRTTIFDGGNYRGDWNQINARYIMTGLNESQWMSGLNYFHRPEYIVVIDDDIGKFYQMARIGERDAYEGQSIYFSSFVVSQKTKNNLVMQDEYPDMFDLAPTSGPGIMTEDLSFDGIIWPKSYTHLVRIAIFSKENEVSEPYGLIYNTGLQQSKVLPFNCKCVRGDKCYDIRDDGIPGCYLFLDPVNYGSTQSPQGVIFIPEMAKTMLFTRLYVVDEPMDEFTLVYDNGVPLSLLSINHMGITNLRIWEINYDKYDNYLLDQCDVETKCSDLEHVQEILG